MTALAKLDTGLLASGSLDGYVRVWVVETGECVFHPQRPDQIYTLAELDWGLLACGLGLTPRIEIWHPGHT